MGLLDKLKKFDEYMSEPALMIRIEKHYNTGDNTEALLLENKQLKKQLQMRRVEAIEAEVKLLEED